MTVGKNAKKREARKRFLEDTLAQGPMPYALIAIEYRDGKRRKLTFASLTAYKKYREEFFPSSAKGRLILESDLSLVDDSNKEATRKAMTNKGLGLGNDTRFARPKTLVKGIASDMQAKGNRFGKAAIMAGKLETIATVASDVHESQARDTARQAAIKAQDNKAERDKQAAFTAMRRKARASLAGL